MASYIHAFLRRVWQAQPANEGYVFLSVKDWKMDPSDPAAWEDHVGQLGSALAVPTTKDLYFCPNVFEKKNRRKVNCLPGRWLYADLDEVDPYQLPKSLQPTIAWQTSPGRYQALWELERALKPSVLAPLNQKLTYHVGADKGGWSLTKVLRVPGSVSTKRGSKVGVIKLWDDGPVYAAADIYRIVKETETPADVSANLPDLVLPSSSARALLKARWTALPLRTKQLLKAKSAEGEDRSDRLWELQRACLEAGYTPEETFVLAKASVFNKYRGQGREDAQLWTEIQRAVGQDMQGTEGSTSTQSSKPSSSKSKKKKPKRRRKMVSYDEFIAAESKKPMWMVEGIWSESAHGMIVGEEKTYKSVVSTDLAISVASGTRFLDHFPVPQVGPVIYIQKENDEHEVRDRFQRIAHSKQLMGSAHVRAGMLTYKDHQSLPIHVMNNEDFDLSDPDDIAWLRRKIRRINPVLIVFDPLYLLAPSIDENSAHEMTPVLERLLMLKQRYNCGTLLLHHFKKQNVQQPIKGAARISGTGVFGRWYESLLLLDRPDMDEPETIKLVPFHRGHKSGGVIYASFDLGSEDDLHYSVDIHRPKEEAREEYMSLKDIVEASNGLVTVQMLSAQMNMGAEAVKRRARNAGMQIEKARVNGRPQLVVKQ